MLGADHVARAAPDGLTLMLTTDALFQVPVVLRRPVPVVAPIGRLGHATVLFIIGPEVPAQVTDMAGFLTWVRGRPMALGHWGGGGSAHALALMLAQGERLDATMVGYRGEPAMLTDMLAGRFAGGFGTPVTFGEALQAGQLRALAVMGAERLAVLPAVPTMAELGLMRDTEYRGFGGLFGPPGMPDAVLAPIAAAFRAAAQDPVLVARMARMGSIAGHADAAGFAAEFALREAQWRAIVTRLDLFQSEG